VILRRDEVGQRSETVRRANLSAIVRELHDRGPLSRSELVARTGLTRSAIRGLIGEFVAADLVSEERPTPLGAPGRPSPLVHLNAEGAVVIALEIAVDCLAVALVGLGGRVMALERVDRPRTHVSVDETVADLVELVARIRATRPPDDPLIGIGVAVAAVVRRSDGLVSMAPNLGWRDVPLGERLAEALGSDAPISVANEADLGALVDPDEFTLIRKLSAYPSVVEGSAVALEPHRIVFYLQELAQLLHTFYFKHRILPPAAEGDSTDAGQFVKDATVSSVKHREQLTPQLTGARLALMGQVGQVIRNGLGLLGVTAPDRM